MLHKNAYRGYAILISFLQLFPLFQLIYIIRQFGCHKETVLNSYLTLGPSDLKELPLEINIWQFSQEISWEKMQVCCFWLQSDNTSL